MAEDEEGEGRATDFLLMTIAGYILSSMQAHSPLKTHFHARAHAYNRSDTTDGAKLVYLGGFVVATAAISLTYDNSFAFDRPIQSSVLAFLVAGSSILLLYFTIPRIFLPGVRNDDYAALPLEDRGRQHGSREAPLGHAAMLDVVSPRMQRLLFVGIVIAVCMRVEVFRQILPNRQCTSPGIEGYVPFLLALYEIWRSSQRHNPEVGPTSPSDRKASSRAARETIKIVLPAVLMACANVLAAGASSNPRSTYICPVASGLRRSVPFLQYLGVILDCSVLIFIPPLISKRRNDTRVSSGKAPLIVGSILLLSAIILSTFGFAVFISMPEHRSWIVGVDIAYIRSLVWMTALFTLLIVCAIRVVIMGNPLDLAMLVSFVSTYIIGFSSSWTSRRPFPPSFRGSTVLSVVVLFLGALFYLQLGGAADRSNFRTSRRLLDRSPSLMYALLVALFVSQIIIEVSQKDEVDFHPIDILIGKADLQHDRWLKQASASRTLGQATDEYRRRYDRHPPPSFDKWYDYATARNSLIIDDYDSIFQDLLPFWALDPQDLRARTREILSDPWNEVAEVSIRSGKAELGPIVLPTHRWMVEGVLAMISNFVELLPDMDLAFNINDECRVAIPYDKLQKFNKIGMNAGKLEVGKIPYWTPNRADTWQSIDESFKPPSRFEDHSFVNNFYSYGSIACPPSSAARRNRIWDPSVLCTSCIAPHSIGPFVSNWTLAASPCHQPDLANLHGFYLSPAAFKTAHEPLPVFSQSKAHGYADILYPSPWNYLDKVKYDPSPSSNDSSTDSQEYHPDPPFLQKQNSLFWRGSTSEGVSALGTWKGMLRQRLVHLTKPNLTSVVDSTPILLPYPSNPSKFKYQYLSPSALFSLNEKQNLTLDVSIVSDIARCASLDCPAQEHEFAPFAQPTDFQTHWQYRFLFDMDGAGFSGRFLPFLQSRSLVFKAGVFREWWESRVTAWRQFVPVDVRLVGWEAVVGYFSGGGGEKGERQGEMIAESGREWAGRVLRKEDMEIYFFRLLLEWGRLTDDRRDEIGFDM